METRQQEATEELEGAVAHLQDDDNDAEDRLEKAELEGSLLAKPDN